MESFDPRKPIIKATEDDEAEVVGHLFSARESGVEPDERLTRVTEDPGHPVDDDESRSDHRAR